MKENLYVSQSFQLGKNKAEAAAKKTSRPLLLSHRRRETSPPAPGDFRRLERLSKSLSPTRRQSPPPPPPRTTRPPPTRPQRGQTVNVSILCTYVHCICPTTELRVATGPFRGELQSLARFAAYVLFLEIGETLVTPKYKSFLNSSKRRGKLRV